MSVFQLGRVSCYNLAVWKKKADGFQEAVVASARPSSITAAGAVGLRVTLRGNHAFNN